MGQTFNSNNLFLDLVENFDEASKNEANWTVTSWIKLKLEKATWSCYFILWLPWFSFLMISRSLILGNSLILQLLSYCLYTILFLWPDWTNLCFEISQIANKFLPRHIFWVTCIQANTHLEWTLAYNKNIKQSFWCDFLSENEGQKYWTTGLKY